MYNVEITFWDGKNEINKNNILKWKMENNEITELWLNKMKNNFKHDFILKSRHSGFRLEDRAKENLLNKLKQCIVLINNCEYLDYKLPEIDGEYSSETHNILHHHFEILMGKTWEGYSWRIKEAIKRNDMLILMAISGLNEFSHEIIDNSNSDKNNFDFPNIITNFLSSEIKNDFLPDSADNFFNLENIFGGIYMHYSQIGKTWMDYLIDDDKVISKEDIEPQKIINGEFDICMAENILEYSSFYNFLKEKLKNIGENIDNKKLRIGRILIAKPLFEKPNKMIIDLMKKNRFIKTINIYNEHEKIIKNFEPYYDLI
jgi:hypothetical protein